MLRQKKVKEDPPVVALAFKNEKKVAQKAFSKTYRLFGTKGRRDAIIATIRNQHGSEPFVAPFIDHLNKIGREKLDPYSKMVFDLSQFNIQLTFLTSQLEVSEMSYPIPDLSMDPDPSLERPRTFLEWLTGPKK
jgi:hypothetical protein